VGMLNFGLPEFLILVVIVGVSVVPAARICTKAGYPAWLGAVAIVPVLNVILAFFLAFAKWPIEKQLESFQQGDSASR
jgi:hypothetical protein